MADVLHKTLPDSELHEPKGVAGAGDSTVYRANGAGSGSWQKITPMMFQGITNNGFAGQPLIFDGAGGFAPSPDLAYIYGTSLTSPSAGDINLLKVPLTPTNNFTQTIFQNITLGNSQFVFSVAGLYHATFTVSQYEASETTNIIRTITAVLDGNTVIGAIANDSKSSTTVSMIFRASSSSAIELRKAGVGVNFLPGVLVQYAIHRIGS